MSSLAQICIHSGIKVSGSDINSNFLTEKMKSLGAKIYNYHSEGNIKNVDCLVYSSAIQINKNLEIQEAQKQNLPCFMRGEFLSKLFNEKRGIAITGTHGKTTTTAIVATLLYELDTSPTVMSGGVLKNFDSNALWGHGNFFVSEADESDGSFHYFKPNYACLTNIEDDHMDFYESSKNLDRAYSKFLSHVEDEGVIICGDDERITHLLSRNSLKQSVKTVGFENSSSYKILNTKVGKGFSQFEIEAEGSRHSFTLNMMGDHNITNAALAIALCKEIGFSFIDISKALLKFIGVSRRLDLVYQNKSQLIYDDYAHHPTEIKKTINCLKMSYPGSYLKILFQPHRYTRVKQCWEELRNSFDLADEVYLLPIYSAGENPQIGIDSKSLKNDLSHLKKVHLIQEDEIDKFFEYNGNQLEIMVCLGAGSVSQLLRDYVKKRFDE